jgi:hypothetical protein
MLVPDHQVRFPNRTPTNHLPHDKLDTFLTKGHGHTEMPRHSSGEISCVRSENSEEQTLREKIATLCADEKQKRKALKGKTRELSPLRSNLKVARAALGMHLSKMKDLLAGTGRDGQWLPFLKQTGLSRSTADRLVKKHRAMESSSPNGQLGDAKEPTETEMQKIAKSVVSKCGCLTTSRLIDLFIVELKALLDAQAAEYAAPSSSNSSGTASATPVKVWEENEL